MTDAADALRRLDDKNADLIGEKRRLRDALTGTHALPAVHLRVDSDRDGIAHISVPVTLDAVPHRNHFREALAEEQRVATRQGSQVRGVRLATSAGRAVIQTVD